MVEAAMNCSLPVLLYIAISQAAFEAIAATLKLGSVGFENKTDEHGQH
jgi:hypothetical protein